MTKKAARFAYAAWIGLLVLSAVLTQAADTQAAFSCSSITDIPVSECEALVALYENTDGANWSNAENWLVTNTAADWAGVTVENETVLILSLNNNNLTGTIPASIGNLIHLEILNLSNNHLSGSIPPAIGNLPGLMDLRINENQLNGSIPPQLGNLSNLVVLGLRNNQLSGSIPAQLGNLSNLEILNLRQNQLDGSIPVQLCDLGNLQELILYENNIGGSIPAQLGNLTNLVILELAHNQLTGSIPPELGNLTKLTHLVLYYNQLGGSIPSELGNLNQLINLELSANQLSGSIPSALGNLHNLRTLFMWENQLTGSIPPQLGNLTNLVWFDISTNHLSGAVPDELIALVNIPDPNPQEGARFEIDRNWLTVPNPYPSNPPNALDVFLMNKNPGWETTQGLRTDIPSGGGEARSGDGSVSILVEAGELSQPVTLAVTNLGKPAVGALGIGFAHRSYNLSAYAEDGSLINPFTFQQPVTLRIGYTEDDLVGLNEDTLRIYFWDNASASWQDASQTCSPASTYVRDPANHTVSIDICHLTKFALMAEFSYTISLPIISR